MRKEVGAGGRFDIFLDSVWKNLKVKIHTFNLIGIPKFLLSFYFKPQAIFLMKKLYVCLKIKENSWLFVNVLC